MSFISTIFSYIISISILILAIGGLGLELNVYKTFIDYPSLMIIIGGIILSMVNFKLSEIYNAFTDCLSVNSNEGFLGRYELNRLIIDSMGKYTIFSSVLFFVVGLLVTLANLENFAQLSTSFANMFLVILYAVIFKIFVLSPLLISLEKKYIKTIVK